ncbi:hypothetical protein [Natrinema sp. 1APR25-10V2]|uniref:hypothetical protein n=1 Tax=Natrinema sp. 1APR25-10V2 TaxID=2951081 RepID=UPI002876248D|nr:hypothetical protein [Natrinema sp. 1APR25-10V2]MDS0474046.1 hypothetical protein [Natrinema sp. 1APR25-10V2]
MGDQVTIYLDSREEFRKDMTKLELEYDEIWDAEMAEVHQAMIDVALNDPDRLIERLQDIQDE